MATTDIRVDILFKKAYGLANAFPNQSSSLETVSNRPAVFPNSQIYQQTIPTTAPNDLTTASFTPANGTISGRTTTKQVSTSNSYIAKYTFLQLKDATGSSNKKVSYYYSATDNLLQYSIPNGFDPVTNTYNITVYDNTGVVVAPDNATNPWVLDNDSGVLTFTSTAASYTFTSGPPSVTFWRYEGSFGFPSSIIGDNVVTRTSTDTLTNKTLTSPILTTPTLGVATATSINKVAFTAPATAATITLADGSTLTTAGNVTHAGAFARTFTATGTTTLTLPTTGTLATTSITDLLAPKNSPDLTGTPTAPTATAGTDTTQIATTAFVKAAVGSATGATGTALLSSASNTFTGTTVSTSASTGTIILSGSGAGLGVAGNINVGGSNSIINGNVTLGNNANSTVTVGSSSSSNSIVPMLIYDGAADATPSYGALGIVRQPNDITRSHLALIRGGNFVWHIHYPVNSNALVFGTASATAMNASFTGSISGTVLTVTAVASGTIGTNSILTGASIPTNTVIISRGTGTGATGTYNLNKSLTIASQALFATTLANVNLGLNGGYVGIGTPNPYSMLSLYSALYTNAAAINFNNPSNNSYTMQLVDNGGANYLRLGRDGFGDLVVNNDGNIGINNSVPTYKLDVVGNTRINQATQSTSALALYNATNAVNTVNMYPYLAAGAFNNMSAANDSGLFWGNALGSATGGFVIAPWVNATMGLRIASNGKVSINTTSTDAALNVGGGITIATGNAITSTGDMRLTSATNNTLFLANDKTGGNILVNYSGGIANTTTAFIVHGSDGTYSTKQNFTILNNGNVGIGQGSPAFPLDISGGLTYNSTAGASTVPATGALVRINALANVLGSIIGNYTPILNLSSNLNGNNSFLNIYNYRFSTGSVWTSASTRIQQTIDGTNMGYIEFNPPNANGGIGLYANSSGNLNASALGLTILNSGNVGIGTNAPIAQLHLYSTLPTSTTAFPTTGHLIVDCARSGAMGGSITVRNSGGANTAGSAASIAFEFDGSTSYNNDGTDAANARIACINEGSGNAGALAFNTWNGSSNGERMRISSAGVVTLAGTTASTSSGSGTMVLSGSGAGLGVAGNIYAGGSLNVAGGSTLTGINYVDRLSELIFNSASGAIAFDYNNGSTFYVQTPATANFTAAFTNVPTTANRTFVASIILNSASNKFYANAVTVNGTAATLLFNGGASAISVASATAIVQTFAFVVGSGSTVIFVFSNVASYQA